MDTLYPIPNNGIFPDDTPLPRIIIDGDGKGQYAIQSNFIDPVMTISVLLDLAKAIAGQLGKNKPIIEKPTMMIVQ